MSGRFETITHDGKEYYTFPHDVLRPNVIYEKLPNGKFKYAGVKGTKTDASTKTTNTTQSKK